MVSLLICRDRITRILVERIRIGRAGKFRAALVDDAHNAADRLPRELLIYTGNQPRLQRGESFAEPDLAVAGGQGHFGELLIVINSGDG